MTYLHRLSDIVERKRWWLVCAIVCAAVGFLFMGIWLFYQEFPARDDYGFIYRGAQAMHIGAKGPYFQPGNVYPPGAMLVFYPLSYFPQIFSSSVVLWVTAALA